MEEIKNDNEGVQKSAMESLSEMVKKPVVFSQDSLDIPEERVETASPQPQVETQTEPQDPNVIKIVPLLGWFDQNVHNFPNIRKPTVSIQGVDANEQLIITVADPGAEKRKLMVFDDIDTLPVLDLPAYDMQILNNGFRILYDLANGTFIKSYGVRGGIISVFCLDINDKLIPYSMVKCKRKDDSLNIISPPDIEVVREKLQQNVDIEALTIQYKQITKAEGLTTNQDAVDWLIERQGSIYDTNHHLQIDNVIINLIS